MIDDQSGDVKQPDLITKPGSLPAAASPKKFIDVVGDNFDSIMKLATDIARIKETKVKSNALVAELNAKSDALLKEAEAYARKTTASSNAKVQEIDAITRMMSAYNSQINPQISEEKFYSIITDCIEKIGQKEESRIEKDGSK